jgi:hypothetical protein
MYNKGINFLLNFMSKLTIAGITFIILGLISGYMQNTYYGYVDAEGVLHDSFFLPLSVLLLILGVLLLIIALLVMLFKKAKKK